MNANKIGNYVHLHLKNYRQYGINQDKGKSTEIRSYQGWKKLINAHDNIDINSSEVN